MKMVCKREMHNQNNEKHLVKTIGYELYSIQFMVPPPL